MELICTVVSNTDENIYIYFDEETHDGVIVDPGAFEQDIVNLIEENNINLKAVLLTHGHYDHIWGAKEFSEKYGIKIYAGVGEDVVTNDPNVSFTSRMDGSKFIADVIVADGEIVEIGSLKFKVIATPGHTPGGVCYLDELQKVMFTGDTLFKGTFGRTDFPHGSFGDLEKSLHRLFEMDSEIKVYPGHYEPTTIGIEKETNRLLGM